MDYSIFRAPTDDDRNIREEWERANYHHSQTRTYTTEYAVDGQTVQITSTVNLCAVTVQSIMKFTVIWTIDGAGTITCKIDAKRNTDMPYLPRIWC